MDREGRWDRIFEAHSARCGDASRGRESHVRSLDRRPGPFMSRPKCHRLLYAAEADVPIGKWRGQAPMVSRFHLFYR